MVPSGKETVTIEGGTGGGGVVVTLPPPPQPVIAKLSATAAAKRDSMLSAEIFGRDMASSANLPINSDFVFAKPA
jgi:hypothetical protein